MARAKISEYRAKRIVNAALGLEYIGLSIDASTEFADEVQKFTQNNEGNFVVKVDQAVKRRNKLGLVSLNIPSKDVLDQIGQFKDAGYRWILVEPYIAHNISEEKFVALQREADGVHLTHSSSGGVDIEEKPESLKTFISQEPHGPHEPHSEGELFRALLTCFDKNHFTYLEINPYVQVDGQYIVLDAAVEVDTSGEFFVKGIWTADDIRTPKKEVSLEEQAVEELASKSPSSLSLKVLNRDGSIFLLLSGGGASVVVADEFSNRGYHEQIANYGEYSGNPNEEETYLYTKQVLKLLLASPAKKKVLLIAGGVANFTDVAKTFKGVIRALQDDAPELVKQDVHVFVRRGGPNQAAGLKAISGFMNKAGISNVVHGPEVSLAEIVSLAVKDL